MPILDTVCWRLAQTWIALQWFFGAVWAFSSPMFCRRCITLLVAETIKVLHSQNIELNHWCHWSSWWFFLSPMLWDLKHHSNGSRGRKVVARLTSYGPPMDRRRHGLKKTPSSVRWNWNAPGQFLSCAPLETQHPWWFLVLPYLAQKTECLTNRICDSGSKPLTSISFHTIYIYMHISYLSILCVYIYGNIRLAGILEGLPKVARCCVRASCANCRAAGSRWTVSISAIPGRSGPKSWDAARGLSGAMEKWGEMLGKWWRLNFLNQRWLVFWCGVWTHHVVGGWGDIVGTE